MNTFLFFAWPFLAGALCAAIVEPRGAALAVSDALRCLGRVLPRRDAERGEMVILPSAAQNTSNGGGPMNPGEGWVVAGGGGGSGVTQHTS